MIPEKASQKSMTFPTRSVHHKSFLWALDHELVRSTTHRFVAQKGAGLPFPEISYPSPSSLSRSRVSFESYPRSRWALICSGNSPTISIVSRVSSNSGESWRFGRGAIVPRGGALAVFTHQSLV